VLRPVPATGTWHYRCNVTALTALIWHARPDRSAWVATSTVVSTSARLRPGVVNGVFFSGASQVGFPLRVHAGGVNPRGALAIDTRGPSRDDDARVAIADRSCGESRPAGTLRNCSAPVSSGESRARAGPSRVCQARVFDVETNPSPTTPESSGVATTARTRGQSGGPILMAKPAPSWSLVPGSRHTVRISP
jgi:hypothetical protein